MRIFITIVLTNTLLCSSLFAQEVSISDTIIVNEVQTIVPYKKYQAGAKIESILKEQFEISQSESLDKLLMRFSPIYIKSDAGGLSSIRFRGTSPDHTTINFGGINVNSLTLGSTNTSNIPMYLFDGINLQYGSSAAVNGSGAIGGALYLGLNSNWTDGQKINTRISEGSFGEQLYGTKIFLGNGKLESVTRTFYYTLKNDFLFKYEGKNYNQKNAKLKHYGLLQELNYKFDFQQWLKTAIWLQSNFHENAMPISNHAVDSKEDGTLDDKFVRIWSEYQNNKGKIDFKAGVGYVRDKQISNKNLEQLITTNRFIAELEINQDITYNIGYKIGVKYRYINPDVYSYSDSIIDYEQRNDIYAMLFYSVLNRLKLTLNMRKQFVTNFNAPFTPTLGAEYKLLTNKYSTFKLLGNIAHSYRIPTFNDRFWGKQGNPNLESEQGMNYELGMNYAYYTSGFQSVFNMNFFYMDIDNWIEWRPGTSGSYIAENRANVMSKGLEFQSKNKWNLKNVDLLVILNYSFNPTRVNEDELTSRIGKSLLYSPNHNGSMYFSVNYKKYHLFLNGTYTGKRQVDYSGSAKNPDGNILDAYSLMDCGFSKLIEIRKHNYSLSMISNNILNTSYINQVGYAMPGRSFRFTLSTDLDFTNK